MKKVFLFSLFLIVLFIASSCRASSSSAEIGAFLPDMSEKTDGVYRGTYSHPERSLMATVDVTVQDNRITDITIVEHTGSPIGRRAERITGNIIEEQSLEIDVISGSTSSSGTILKAVENALQ